METYAGARDVHGLCKEVVENIPKRDGVVGARFAVSVDVSPVSGIDSPGNLHDEQDRANE